jgi:hypothetical protein
VVRPADNREVMCSNHIGPILHILVLFFYPTLTHGKRSPVRSWYRNYYLFSPFFIDIYPGTIGGVIPGALARSVFIMQEPRDLPHIIIFLCEDEKGVVIKNKEN